MGNFSRFFALCKALGCEAEYRNTLVWQHTNNRTASLKDMTDSEYKSLCNSLQREADSTPAAKLEKDEKAKQEKIIQALCYQLHWTKPSNQKLLDYEHINNWFVKFSPFKKAMSWHSSAELKEVVNQLRNIVNKERSKGSNQSDLT
jgi:hypothetical protein